MRSRTCLLIGAIVLLLTGALLLVKFRTAPQRPQAAEAPRRSVTEAPPAAALSPAPAGTAHASKTPTAPTPAAVPSALPPTVQAAVPEAPITPPLVVEAAPALGIDSPADGGVYYSSVGLNGTVEDSEGSRGAREVDVLSWKIEGTHLGGTIPFSPEGAFSVLIPTDGLQSTLTLVILAHKKNGRTAEKRILLLDDGKGPAFTCLSPPDGSVYGSTITVTGRVAAPGSIEGRGGDHAVAIASAAEVSRLSWRVIGRPSLCGDISFEKDGRFSLSLPTAGLRGDLVLELAARDRNGHSSFKALTLVPQPATAGLEPSSPEPTPPVLTLETPAQGSSYRSSVTVSGRLRPVREGPSADAVSWALVGTTLAGTARVKDDGAFTFEVPTVGLRGTQALAVRAAPSGGPAAETTLVLYEDTRALPLAILSPADGGYYRAATILEGRVGDESLPASEELASLSWKTPARPELGGHAVVEEDGSFKVALPFTDLSGDVAVAITAEDKGGRLAQKTLTLHDGTKKPGLSVSAPADGSPFGSLIRVAGRITDPYAGAPEMSGIETLSWLVAPADYSRHSTPARGTAALAAGNSFRFAVPTAGLSGPQQLTLTARARNGNATEMTVRLLPGDGDVPGFSVDPSDREVSVSWDRVPFAERYDLTYGPAGSPPGALRTISGVSPPFTVTGLNNGSLYEFRLAVGFDDGGRGSSIAGRAIPLAPETLAPVVKGDYQQIRLSWKTIPGASAYDVWRSLSSSSGFAKIASSVSSSRYLDTAVQFGRDYYYAISPSGLKAPLSAPGSGRTLAFPEAKLALIGTAALTGARRITIHGGYAFVAAGARGVTIVDVSDPKAPVPVGRVATRDARQVAVRGDYAYVADGEAGLRVLDVSNPRAPEIIGSCKTSDARAVALFGIHAFVADGARGLKMIDVSDARSLPRVAVMETTDARDVAVSGDRLFLADGPGGLKIFSLARPRVLSLIASLPAADARTVAVHAGTAVIADGAQGLRIVDLKDPSRPVIAATFETDMACSAATDGRFAYMTDDKGAIKVIDIKDPASPSLFTAHRVNGPVSVTVMERTAYIADSAGLEIMRIQIYGRSFRVASCETGGKAFQVAVSGSLACVAAHAQGVRVVDVDNPSQVTDASAIASAPARYAESVTVADGLAFVADGSAGIRIFDFRKARAPAELGAYRTGGYVHRVTVSGTRAYAANGDLGLRILDVSNPSTPSEIGSLRTDDAHDVAVGNGVAWVADGDSGLRAIDVSDPAHPRLVSRPIAGTARVLAMSGNILLVGGADGVRIFDVTDPRAPRLEGRYDSNSVRALEAAGRYAYVAEGHRGLTVLDISRANQPVVASSCAEVFAMGVAVTGDYALVADSVGLQVIRILVPDWLSH